MKEIIHGVLARYVGTEANMDSLALREMITDEITYELECKGIAMIDTAIVERMMQPDELTDHLLKEAVTAKSEYVDDDLSI